MNRNSNIKKVIRGGNGSIYRPSRASTYIPNMDGAADVSEVN